MRSNTTHLLLAAGLVAFLIAGLSITDMFLPRPYDGVVLEADAPGRMMVSWVVDGSGAHRAGIRPGDQILGIDRNLLRSPRQAAELLNRRSVGDIVPYFIAGDSGSHEVMVELGPRRIGSLVYLYSCVLGFAFFLVGGFVLVRQPRLRAAQLFFALGTLFLLFLVCRLRPASYSWVDSFVLTTGMIALLFLPACFLHFFLIFPRPVALRPAAGEPRYSPRRRLWLGVLAAIYVVPPLILTVRWMRAWQEGGDLHLISGAPIENWWALAVYMLAGLAALALNSRRLTNPRERAGAALVLVGSLFGLLPFLVTVVAFPSWLHTDRFLVYGVAPLALVPLTFAYAIVRFQLLDIRIILRKSLLYTATTAVITLFYALCIALFDRLSTDTDLAASRFFPIVFALAIVLLFEPLRRRLQKLVDRFFYARQTRLEVALRRLGEEFTGGADLEGVVRNLVDELPQLLDLHFAALYLLRGSHLDRVAGPAVLPEQLPALPGLPEEIRRAGGLVSLDRTEEIARELGQSGELATRLRSAGVELVGELATSRRPIGALLLSGKSGQLAWDSNELELTRSLLHQAAIALETSLLLEERTEQAELERELEIAAQVQAELLPPRMSLAPGFSVAALCRPARHVGGDFYTELPGPRPGVSALVYGDVAGKSVSGALVMMAAHEALHSLALSHQHPEDLLDLANRRLYGLGRNSFVAVAYLTVGEDGGLDYLLAGQPQPLLRTAAGAVVELALPANRLPLGSLINGRYRICHAPLAPGDLVLGYSDGVLDARSPHGEVFGAERLARVVAAAPSDPETLLGDLSRALDDFTQGTEPYDDVTLVALRRDREVPV